MVHKHEHTGPNNPPGFFNIHIVCTNTPLTWTIEQESPAP
jgi:hypothetical protein